MERPDPFGAPCHLSYTFSLEDLFSVTVLPLVLRTRLEYNIASVIALVFPLKLAFFVIPYKFLQTHVYFLWGVNIE